MRRNLIWCRTPRRIQVTSYDDKFKIEFILLCKKVMLRFRNTIEKSFFQAVAFSSSYISNTSLKPLTVSNAHVGW